MTTLRPTNSPKLSQLIFPCNFSRAVKLAVSTNPLRKPQQQQQYSQACCPQLPLEIVCAQVYRYDGFSDGSGDHISVIVRPYTGSRAIKGNAGGKRLSEGSTEVHDPLG